jgi:cell envelope opacity-associated protein A
MGHYKLLETLSKVLAKPQAADISWQTTKQTIAPYEEKMDRDLSSAVQTEVARLRDMISTTKAFFPNRIVNFYVYEIAIEQAEKAVREGDAAKLVRILPELQKMG